MKGDFHVRFRENAGVKFPCVTRLAETRRQHYRNKKICRQKQIEKIHINLKENR